MNKEETGIKYLGQDDIRDYIIKKDYEIYKLQQRIDKAIKEVKELYEMAKEQDSDNVNLIDRLELILKKLRGKDNDKYN